MKKKRFLNYDNNSIILQINMQNPINFLIHKIL